MKKFFKMFFSRMFLVGLTIVLVFLFNVAVVLGLFWLGEQALINVFPAGSIYLQIIAALLQWFAVTVTVLHIVNRDMIPEAKIPWILCVVVLNVFGVAVYAVFSNNRPPRKVKKKYEKLKETLEQFIPRSLSPEETENALSYHAQMSEAILRKNRYGVLFSGTKTKYFPSGEEFFEQLLVDLKSAKEFIFMEYFILAKGKMWNEIHAILKQKVADGVDVRLIYDDIGCMGKLRAGYAKKLRKEGIKCIKFNPFVPIVTNLHNNRDHRKITVIDGKVGYTGGLNLADEYINETHPFGYWKDTAVRLEGVGVRGLTAMFLQAYSMRKREEEDFSRFFPELQREEQTEDMGYVQPFGSGPRPLYPRHLGEDVYIDVLTSAKKYVYITTPYLIIDYRMRETMLQAAARGVDVRIVVPHIPDKKLVFALTRSNYMALIKGGVKIYEYTPGFVHAKSFLSDDRVAVVGTINLDYRSLLHHYEDAVVLYGTQAGRELKEDFEKIFEDSKLQTEEDAKKNIVFRGLCEVAKVFAPLF